jgi:hypothetical protein
LYYHILNSLPENKNVIFDMTENEFNVSSKKLLSLKKISEIIYPIGIVKIHNTNDILRHYGIRAMKKLSIVYG